MVYVFGIEGVPLFEMLFIIMVLMIAGLVFILLELKKLRELLTEEKSDISRFEKDLTSFEHQKQEKAPSTELMSYVKLAKSKGLPDARIEEVLVQQGWHREQVDKILADL